MDRATPADLTDAEIAAAFNRVYEGYVLAFAVDAARARDHLRLNDGDPAASPVRLAADGAVAALAALGVRGDKGWAGGFGPSPDLRGRGFGRVLVEDTIAAARERGVRRLGLVVPTTNRAGIAPYERAGFRRVRTLRIFASPEAWSALDADGRAPVTPADPNGLLAHHNRFHRRPVAWQRDPAGVARRPDLHGLAIGSPASPEAHPVNQATGDLPIHLSDVAAPADGRSHLWALPAGLRAELQRARTAVRRGGRLGQGDARRRSARAHQGLRQPRPTPGPVRPDPRQQPGLLAPHRQIPEESVVLAAPSSDLHRYTEPRPRKLSIVQVEDAVSAVATGRTLRDVAHEFGVSAERIRQLVRDSRSAGTRSSKDDRVRTLVAR